MHDPQYDPAPEKEVLYAAIGIVYEQWDSAELAQASMDLLAAIQRAARALSLLEPEQDK